MDIMDILDPHHIYHSNLKSLHHQNAENFFDELVKKSNVNIEENKKTINELKNFELYFLILVVKPNQYPNQ